MAIGVTAYGVAYLVVHEVFIHRRLDVPLPRWRYLGWLRRSHALHHRYGGEPYGMLLPVVPRALRERAAADGWSATAPPSTGWCAGRAPGRRAAGCSAARR